MFRSVLASANQAPSGSVEMSVISRFSVAGLFDLFSRLPAAMLASVVIHASAFVVVHYFSADLFHGAGSPVSGRALVVSLHEISGVKGNFEDKMVSHGAFGDSPVSAVSEVESASSRVVEVVASKGDADSDGGGTVGYSSESVRHYYPADQLSVRPVPLSEMESPDFDMPMQDRRASVVIDVSISELGEVVSVQPVMSGLPDNYTESLVTAFSRLRFKPGEIDGRRVGSLLRVELTAENLGLPVQ